MAWDREVEVRGFQVETCSGSGGCPKRAVNSEDMPQHLEELLSGKDLKAFLKGRVKASLKKNHGFRVSVSDCPNACSRPQIVDVGLIGARSPGISETPCDECGACLEVCREGALSLRGPLLSIDHERCLSCGQCITVCPTGTLVERVKGYRILVGGKLGRHPRLATELKGIHGEGEVLEVVDRCLDIYRMHCRKGERFREILERKGWNKKNIGFLT